MQKTKDNKRIVKNTLYLYFRMVIVMLVTLYTSRVILMSLGVQDFGIYNLVFGVVAIFNVVNGALTDASLRFITFELGKGGRADVNAVFSHTVMLHFLLAIAIFAIAESGGLWFMYNKLIIPENRLNAAFWIFQFALASLFILIISVPYNALIIAHERMKAFAFISIIDVVAKLVAAFLLLIEGPYDKLILYGFLMLISQIIQRILYTIYCKREFPNIRFHFCWNKQRIVELLKFATWTVYGNLAYIGTTQGISVLLGMFFLPVVNAARGIAVVVQGAVDSFVRSFQTAVNPQITKTYAAKEIEETVNLVFNSSKYSFYLMLLPLVPLILETNYILNIWLAEVPNHTVDFVRYALVISLFSTMRNPMEVAVKATGEIKHFELMVYTAKILTLPIAYAFLFYGHQPTTVFGIQTAMEVIALLIGVKITSKSLKINNVSFYKSVLARVFPTSIIAFIAPSLLIVTLPEGILRLLAVIIVSIIWTCFTICFIGIRRDERRNMFQSIIRIYDKKIISKG